MEMKLYISTPITIVIHTHESNIIATLLKSAQPSNQNMTHLQDKNSRLKQKIKNQNTMCKRKLA